MQRPSSGELGVGGLDVRRGLTKPRDEGTDSPVHPPQEQVCHFQKHCKKKKKNVQTRALFQRVRPAWTSMESPGRQGMTTSQMRVSLKRTVTLT